MLTKKSKYGLKVLLLLAREHDRGPVLISELAERERIPKKFLELILLDLKHHGILQSRKGPGGGYHLRRSPDRISIGEVIRILEGPLALVPCVSQMAYMPCDECESERDCAVRRVFKKVRDETARILDGTTLASASRLAGGDDDRPARHRSSGESPR
jgi:Rrf2 family protein